jgi:hypothetical protein
MWRLAPIPFLAHSLGMLLDEAWFHRRRRLPAWERWGHPLDTLTVLACYGLALAMPPSRGVLIAYMTLAAFSCLFITKDEWIHARHCTGGEMWLHAFLAGQTLLTALFLGYQLFYWNGPWKPALPTAR